MLVAVVGCACACLSSDSRLVLSGFVFAFIALIATLLVRTISAGSSRNLFVAGFSLGCLVFFFADSVSSFSLSTEFAEIYTKEFQLNESYTVHIPYTEKVKSTYTVAVPIFPAREAIVFRCLLAMLVGIVAAAICQIGGRTIAG